MSIITDLIPTTLPAYHEKYRVGGYNRLGKLCYASILRRTEVAEGSWPIEVNGAGASPVTISTSYADKDFFSPISGSSCKISMVADSYDQLLELGRGDDTMWKVEVVDDGDTIFRGFLKPETFQMEYGYEKPIVNVEATDGLGVLRNVEFLSEIDFQDVTGEYEAVDIISYILYKAGNTGIWRDYVDYSIGTPEKKIFYHMKLTVWNMYRKSCYDVLTEVLSIFNMQIISDKNIYVIRLMDKPKQLGFDHYTYRGFHAYSANIDESIIDLYGNYEGVSGRLTSEQPVRDILFEAANPAVEELIYNGDFSKGDEGWSVFGGYASADWSVVDNNRVELKTGSPINQTHKGIRTKFSRGFGPQLNALIEFEVRVSSFDSDPWWRIDLSRDGTIFQSLQWQQEPDEWKKLKYVMTWSDTEGVISDRYLYFRPWNDGDVQRRIQIRNVTMTPGLPGGSNIENFSPVQDYEQEWRYTVNANNSQDVKHEIKYAFGGGNYRYTHSFPYAKYLHSTLNKTIQENRIILHYESAKNRLNVDVYKKSDSDDLRPHSQIFDKYLNRIFTLQSFQYDLLRCKYSLELLSYRKATQEEFMKWIFHNDEWDDDGFWLDEVENVWN